MIIPKEYQENPVLMYHGTFTVNLISILGNHLRILLESDTRVIQRVFKIFIELAQNVCYYAADTSAIKNGTECGKGWVSVQDMGSFYLITTGNVLKPGDGEKLTQYCLEINGLEPEALKALKRDIRSQGMVRETGAHIGLIQISLLSGSKLFHTILDDPRSGNSFIISARVNK